MVVRIMKLPLATPLILNRQITYSRQECIFAIADRPSATISDHRDFLSRTLSSRPILPSVILPNEQLQHSIRNFQ